MMVGGARSLSAPEKCSNPRPTSRNDSPRSRCEFIISAIASNAAIVATHRRSGCKGVIAQEMMITVTKTEAISSALTARIEMRALISPAGAGRFADDFSSISSSGADACIKSISNLESQISKFQNDECDGMILGVRQRDVRANDSKFPGDLGGAAVK